MIKRAIVATFLFALLLVPQVHAQEKGFLPDCVKTVSTTSDGTGQLRDTGINGDCGVEDFVQLFVNLADWGLSILGLLTIFFFAWGGFDWIISAGRAGMVESGKKKMLGAVTGLLLVLIAWILIGFFVGALTGNIDGYIFPNDDAPIRRLWFGDKSSCKDTYVEQCNLTTGIHEGCGDNRSTERGEIYQIQLKLIERSCGAITADGCYGPQTAAAVGYFQTTNNIAYEGDVELGPSTYGVVRSDTFNLLNAGGFDCGTDPNPPLAGCCIPKGFEPTPQQACLPNTFKDDCENNQHGNPPIDYYFQAGSCPVACGGPPPVGNQPPVINGALAVTPTSGAAPLGVSYSASVSDPEGDTILYSWDLGDGTLRSNIAGGHTYTLPGVYDLRLCVTDQGGSGQQVCDNDNIEISVWLNQPPTISSITPNPSNFSSPGQVVTFTPVASDPEGDQIEYTWDLPDGSQQVTQNLNYAFTASGNHNITLTVRDIGQNSSGQANQQTITYTVL